MRFPHPPLLLPSARGRLSIALAVVLTTTAAHGLRAPAPAAGATPPLPGLVTAPASALQPLTPLALRRGGGFRSRPRTNLSDRNRRVARRNPNTGRAMRSLSRTILRALGIGFLLSLLFGIGPGGSPLGLLILLGIIALVVVSRRRRRQYSYR